MNHLPASRSPGRSLCCAWLVFGFSLGLVHAETADEHLLKVYRENYRQLVELGLSPAEAAAEARKVAKDSADWARRQHAKGIPQAGGDWADPRHSMAVNSVAANATDLPGKSEAEQPASSPFTDEQDAPAIPLTPATTRRAVQLALEEVKQAATASPQTGGGINKVSTPTYNRILKLAQESRMTAVGASILDGLAKITNAYAVKPTTGGRELPDKNEQTVKSETERVAGNLDVLLSTNRFSPKAFLHVGYVTLNPFTFRELASPTNLYQLDDTSSSAGYVEFQYNNRWAWNFLEPGPAELRRLNWGIPFSRWSDFDLQARFGYSFVQSDKYEVSSIVGGGNISGEFTVGSPFLKYQNDWVRYSLNLEATYGATADRSAFDIHSTFMAGVGYHASLDSDYFPGRVLVSVHLGAGMVEVPVVDNRQLGLISKELNRPDFDAKWGVIGLTFETMLPLNAVTYIVAGGRLYGNADPNPWSAYIGLSLELGSLRKIFSADPLLGDQK